MLLLNPPTKLVLAWLLMLVAMMPPLLARPMEHLWFVAVAERRFRALGLFIVAYIAVWTLAGVALMATAVAVEVLGSAAGFPAFVPIGFVAFVWQTTPLKQASLNFCHRAPQISPSGLAADRDCLHYGLSTALGCVGACWALMLVPLVVHRLDCPTMVIISAVLLLERQTQARPTRWRFPLVKPMMLAGLRGFHAFIHWWRVSTSMNSHLSLRAAGRALAVKQSGFADVFWRRINHDERPETSGS